MNTSQKGARLERAIANALADRGWSVVRSAASKSYGPGKIDLIAIHPGKKEIIVMQAKNFKKYGLAAGEKERTELWQRFNSNFEKTTYTLRCELVTMPKDVEILDKSY